MKIGDKVYHKELSGIATIVKVNIQQSEDIIRRKTVIRTEYVANYPTGESITFYEFNIGKTVFKYEPLSQQMSIFDYIEN